MKNLKYFAFALLLGFFSCETDHTEKDTNTERLQGSADVTLTVVDKTGAPVSGVSVSETHYDIDEVTNENGEVLIHFDEAPSAISNLTLKHNNYQTSTTTVAIGTVKRGENKKVSAETIIYEKEYIYTASLTLYDKDDGLPVSGASVRVLDAPLGEVDPAYSDEDGVAVVILPTPAVNQTDEYQIEITCIDFDTIQSSITIAYSSLAVKGEAWNNDNGARVMKYIGEGKDTGPHNEVIEATLEIPYSETDYSGGTYSFPESKITKAFGLDDDAYATALEAGEITIVGVDADGTTHPSNTNGYGCWWGENQLVKGWGGDARVFFEGSSLSSFTVGQYPKQCTKGSTYPTSHMISYTDKDGNTWTVTFNVKVTVV